MKAAALPLGLFVVLLGFLLVGLQRDPREIPSPLVGKPVPTFTLAALASPDSQLDQSSLEGRPRLLNVWASWCSACRIEHPLLVELARRGEIEIVGLNYKDERPAALDWLARRGDPYSKSIFDPDGRLGLDLGVYGVPETFLIDPAGVIRYKQVGPLTPEIFERELRPRLAAMQAQTP